MVYGDLHHVSSPANEMGGRRILMRETVIGNSSSRNRQRFRATKIKILGCGSNRIGSGKELYVRAFPLVN
jgi:hypothetical protein